MEIPAPETAERWAPGWWAAFLVGLLLWGATVAGARLTHNIILLPTIVLLGSFLVRHPRRHRRLAGGADSAHLGRAGW